MPKMTRKSAAHCGQKLKMTPNKYGYDLYGRKGQFQSLLTVTGTDTRNFRRVRMRANPACVERWRTTRGKTIGRFCETRRTVGAATATKAAAAAARGKTTS